MSHGAADDSPDRDKYSIEAAKVSAWHKPAPGPLPHYTYDRHAESVAYRSLTVDAKAVDT